MSDVSAILALPYLQPAQAQKHVTHNEALRLLDILVQLVVADRDLTAPPAPPVEGERHIVAPGATADWAGQEGKIAVFASDGWQFVAPQPGWQAQVLAEGLTVTHDGSQWQDDTGRTLQVAGLGVNAAADATNRLTVASDATLMSHAGAGHQLKINKAAAPDTASLLFQTGWSGRAEMGLAGDDNFSVKVSPDGVAWNTALSLAGASGAVAAPAGMLLPDGSAAAPGLRFVSDTDTGLYRSAANVLAAATGGATRWLLSNTAFQIDVPITGSAVQASITDATAGRLMPVGAFGLGGTAISYTGSVDDQTLPSGLYFAQGVSTGTKPASWGYLQITKVTTGARALQRWTTDSGKAYVRSYVTSAWSAWNLVYSQVSTLGTVSQSGGVPTGAVIERGSNANGEYVRFADGTQICSRRISVSLAIDQAYLGGFRSAAQTWTYPAAFAAAPAISLQPEALTALAGVVANTPGPIAAQWVVTAIATQAAAGRDVAMTAIGRWF